MYVFLECKKDILILWDNSQSIGGKTFKEDVVPFLLEFVKKVNVSEDGAHVGFISFSTEEETKPILKIGSKNTVEELTAWLKGLKYENLMGTWTHTGSAFSIANKVRRNKPSPHGIYKMY